MRKKYDFRLALVLVATGVAMSWLLASTLAASSDRAQHTSVLTRHVRDIVVNQQAPLVGVLDPKRRLHLAVMLPLRDQAGLDDLLQRLYEPESPAYHQFLTVQEFTDRFGPEERNQQAVVRFLEAGGMTVTRTTPNHTLIDVTASVADINRVFHLTMGVYQHPSQARTFYAPDREPSLDLGIPLWHISGLDDFSPPRPLLRYAPKENPQGSPTGSGPKGDFIGSDMRAAYYGGTALTGKGQAIGLYGANFNISDVEAYFNAVGQPFNPSVVQTVSIDGANTTCGEGCNDGEPVIDILSSLSMAPGVDAVIEYEGNSAEDIYTQMATDNIAKQLSTSFGTSPSDSKTDEPIFMEFGAQGQNLFAAAGDHGAYDASHVENNPVDDPFVVSVGGTDLTTNGAGGSYQSETAWVGSGGGLSTNGFAIPSYQKLPGVINASNQGSTTLRNIPDVSMEADTNNFVCQNGDCSTGVGGTSFSAPRWAGFLALINEQANGKPVGFLNPAIYAIGTGDSYASDFHDITTGNNFNETSPDMYTAVKGYDLVTGWGSPNGQNLINALAPVPSGPNFGLAATPNTLNLTPGGAGTTSIALNPVSGFDGNVVLTVTALGAPAGVTVSLNPSVITGGSGTTTLTVTTTGSTPGGNFEVVVTGTGGGLTQMVYVSLAMDGFTLVTNQPDAFVNEGGTSTVPITVVAFNGFQGTVGFSAGALEKGITAKFKPRHATGATELEFKASADADTELSTVTVTGTAGNLVQTVVLNLAVNAQTGEGGAGKPVDLSSAYNVTGIYSDGTMFSSTGGIDGGGTAYSANLLTTSRILNGIQFNFGPANALDVVSGSGGPVISLPAGNYGSLRILGAGVNGDQSGQTITVTYTDGSTQTYTQTFSDWHTPESQNSGEEQAVAMAYRDESDGTQNNQTFNLYGYSFGLQTSKKVQSVKLPNDHNVVVLAITLSKN